MPSTYTFSLAAASDDAALRRLLANNAMPGRITITFEREPAYFLGCPTMGTFYQVAIARAQPEGDLAAVLCRATQPRFINGQPVEFGYIGQLRVDEAHRGRWIPSLGLHFVYQLHQDGRVPAYLVAISDENRTARGLLVAHPRPGFPTLREVAQIHTLGIILRRSPLRGPRCVALEKHRAPQFTLRRGTPALLPTIVAFLREHGAAKQYFPAYTNADFGPQGLATGFAVEDFILAYQGQHLVGVLGVWDQAGCKQTIVQDYSPDLRRLRPFYNLGARILGAQPLPAPGEHLRSAYAAFICTAGNDPGIFRALLREAYTLAAARRYAYLMVGLCVGDPLLAEAAKYPHITYYSRLYVAAWEEPPALDARIPYIEIAAL